MSHPSDPSHPRHPGQATRVCGNEPPSRPVAGAEPIAAETGLEKASRIVSRRLIAGGVESSEALREARRLVCAATGRPGIDLIAEPSAEIGVEAAATLAMMLARRLKAEPISRITGEREFYGRTFEVTPATLDPRPDSETLIDAAKEIIADAVGVASVGLPADGSHPAGARSIDASALPIAKTSFDVLDLGTGTGCLLLTLLAEFPAAQGSGTDISPGSLEVARRNAQRLGLEHRAAFRQADGLEELEGRYDILISNPPYIADREMQALEPSVRDYDPEVALRGGPDGLGMYRRIAAAAADCLTRKRNLGWVVLEVGATQSAAVMDLLRQNNFTALRAWRDLGGHVRCVAGQTRC